MYTIPNVHQNLLFQRYIPQILYFRVILPKLYLTFILVISEQFFQIYYFNQSMKIKGLTIIFKIHHFKTIIQKCTTSNQPSKVYLSKHLLKILYFTRIFKNITFRNNLLKFTISQISLQNSPISNQFQSNLIKHSIPATLLGHLQALVQKTFNKTPQKISYQSCSAQSYVILSCYVNSTRHIKNYPPQSAIPETSMSSVQRSSFNKVPKNYHVKVNLHSLSYPPTSNP